MCGLVIQRSNTRLATEKNTVVLSSPPPILKKEERPYRVHIAQVRTKHCKFSTFDRNGKKSETHLFKAQNGSK